MNLIKLKCENCGAVLDVNTDLEKIHCNYCGAEILIDDKATELKRIEDVKLKARKENHEQTLKERQDFHEQEMKEKNDLEEQNSVEKFKKSKLSKFLMIFAVICGLLTFKNGFCLKSVISVAQFVLFLTSWFMGMGIIKQPRKKMHIILAVIAFLLIIPYMSLGNGGKSNKTKNKQISKIDYSEIELIDHFPKPDKMYGNIGTNRSDLLIIDISDVTKKEFKSYVNDEVSEKGYTIDLEYEEWDQVYGAFNSEGYSIRIIYDDSDNEMNITLKSPEKMEEFQWPTTGLATVVPATKSTIGNIKYNNSNEFIIHVGNTGIDEYNNYVNQCENIGFVVDYEKDKKYYHAKNNDGYDLEIRYLGGNVMEVSVENSDNNEQIEEKTNTEINDNSNNNNNNESNNVENTKTESQNTENSNNSQENSTTGIRPDFKKAMDSYEKAIDEYINFMKKYEKSDGTDINILTDYTKYLNKYENAVKDFDNWNSKDLNQAEQKYYIEVQTRVNNKLLNY